MRNRKLSYEQVCDVIKRKAEGERKEVLAEEFGVSVHTILSYWRRRNELTQTPAPVKSKRTRPKPAFSPKRIETGVSREEAQLARQRIALEQYRQEQEMVLQKMEVQRQAR